MDGQDISAEAISNPVPSEIISSGETLPIQKAPGIASISNDVPIARKPPNSDDEQLLLEAAGNGNEIEVERLLGLNVPIGSKSASSETALHLAARNGHASVVDLLLKRNADVEARDGDKWVPLCGAAAFGCTDIVAMLLDHGSEIELRATVGWTSLIAAVKNTQYSTIKLLLERGAAASVRNDNLATPLAIACAAGDRIAIPVIELLLDHNSQLELPDSNGWTPLM